MQYRKLGKTGLTISEITYGSWLTFGSQVELDLAKEMIDSAFNLGINSFDTADVYRAGEAEKLLGQILPNRSRSTYIVATKAFWDFSEAPTDKGLSRKHLFDSVFASLDRLNLKYVDLFYCHRYDPETPLEETCEAFDDLIRKGKILYWGTSEWTAKQIKAAYDLCKKRGWHLPVVNQPNYSLLVRVVESEILPTCVKLGIGTANFSPMAQGILSGKYSGGKIPQGTRGADKTQNMWMLSTLENKQILANVDKMADIAKRYNIKQSQLALAWLLQNKAVSSVIVGATTQEQLKENVLASGIVIKKADLATLDKLFPAPKVKG
ncbi:voltage-gated potassium channel [Fibrobacterales bacterium]|nr:voltage-gated potassium channel [Fibrobacterales bacterium]